MMIASLGRLFRHKRDWDRAIFYHQLQLKLDPGHQSYTELGSVLTEAHRDDEAIKAYEAALQFNDEDFFSKVVLAGLYERNGDRQKGRALFATIQVPRASKLGWYGVLAWYYANLRDEALLLDNMRKALELDRSGQTYQWLIREPDLDPFRKLPAFRRLMKQHAPRAKPKLPAPATREPSVKTFSGETTESPERRTVVTTIHSMLAAGLT
jgi:tetratricopeptide (TPR) repeat protein